MQDAKERRLLVLETSDPESPLARAEVVQALIDGEWFDYDLLLKVPAEELSAWRRWLSSLPFDNWALKEWEA